MPAETQAPNGSDLTRFDELVVEAGRQFTICNACRYCEGYCAVFPALERRSVFEGGDVTQIANLCHDCQACYQACMYAPPHPFSIDFPSLLAETRTESYRRYVRPRWLSGAFGHGPRAIAGLWLAGIALVLITIWVAGGLDELSTARSGPGAFYELVPAASMIVGGLLFAGFGVAVAAVGFVLYWRDVGGRARELLDPRMWGRAGLNVLALRWMRGGGPGCYDHEGEGPTSRRRLFHQLTAYGFVLTFGATVAAAIYEHLLGKLPPYPVLSVPVMLGLVGGIGVMVGATGLLRLRLRARRTMPDGASMEITFISVLLFTAVTGMALLVLRETTAMGTLLVAHLAAVVVLFLTAPYGKFVHAVYRFAALLRDTQERRVAGEGL